MGDSRAKTLRRGLSPRSVNTVALYELFERTTSRLTSRAWHALQPIHLTPFQALILVCLDRETTLTPTALAEFFSVSKPTMSEVLRNLRARHLLSKSRTQMDGRIHHVKLTSKGKHQAEAARRRLASIIPSTVLTEAEGTLCTQLLSKLGELKVGGL